MAAQISGIETIDLQKVVATLDVIWRKAVPILCRVVQAAGQIQKAQAVKGYEDFFISEGRHPFEARLLANVTLKIGKKLYEERVAERRLASAVRDLAKVRGETTLVIARRATKHAAAFEDPLVQPTIWRVWMSGDLSGSPDVLRVVISDAAERDRAACQLLTEIAEKLRPNLRNSRGRVPELPSATHEVLLDARKRGAYTYDPVSGKITDAATQATRIALDAPDFDPRPAHSRQKRKSR
jgi:hypothetical protein